MIDGYCKTCDGLTQSETVLCPDCGNELLVSPTDVTTDVDFVSRTEAALKQAEKPHLTTVQLAERLGVSRPTIGNHRCEIEESDTVKLEKVANTYIFWLNND